MSKERLEEIKDRYMDYGHDFNLKKEDVEFLLKQAERAQELEALKEEMENRYKIWHIGAKKSLAEKEELKQQNKRYREALEEIYGLAEYDEYDNTLEQIVSEVEKALEGEK